MPRLVGGQLSFTSLRENKKLDITGKRTSAKNTSMWKNLAQFCKPIGAYQHQYEVVQGGPPVIQGNNREESDAWDELHTVGTKSRGLLFTKIDPFRRNALCYLMERGPSGIWGSNWTQLRPHGFRFQRTTRPQGRSSCLFYPLSNTIFSRSVSI